METVPHRAEPEGRSIGRFFWLIFSGAWLLYGALFLTASLAEGHPLRISVLVALAEAFPLAAVATLIALARRRLFQPDRTLPRMAALHLGVALLYAVVAGLLTELTVEAVVAAGIIEGPEGSTPFIFRMVNGTLLYVIFAGFLMWTESVQRVQESRALAAREAMLRAQAESKALRAQFNPHFVFNTLHSLMLLVRADPAAAERAIEDVAGLIRYASRLQREAVDAVRIEQEIAFARRYLALEQLRLGDRLEVAWELDSDFGRRTVPAFALQTLLENAVRHGVAPRPQGGTIRVRARLDGDALVLTVEDDGAGARPESVSSEPGRGLDLLRQRLEMLYGEAASLRWTTAPGRGFSATVRIPREDEWPAVAPERQRAHAGADSPR